MAPTADPDVAPHRHAWTVLDFLAIHGRPMMKQRCGCGTSRTTPAWDRTWTPSPREEQGESRASGHPDVAGR
jgi:hypothetical protein